MFLCLLAVCNHWPLEGFAPVYCEWGRCFDCIICNVKSEWFTLIQCAWTTGVLQSSVLFSDSNWNDISVGLFLWPCEMVRKRVSSFRNGDCLINKGRDERRKSLVMPSSLFTAIDSDEWKIQRMLGVDCPPVLRGEFITFAEVSFFFVYSKCG